MDELAREGARTTGVTDDPKAVDHTLPMIECVAQAIHEVERDHLGALMWESLDESERDWWRLLARAAIEAIREPTRAVGMAGAMTPHAKHYVELAEKEGAALMGEPVVAPLHGAAMACEIWAAMIDAVLASK